VALLFYEALRVDLFDISTIIFWPLKYKAWNASVSCSTTSLAFSVWI